MKSTLCPLRAFSIALCHSAFRPGVLVRNVIARREVSSSLIFTWRKQARLGKLGGVARGLPTLPEVHVAEVEPVAPAPQPRASAPGCIFIELPGGVQVNVDGSVDAGALARVLSVLR